MKRRLLSICAVLAFAGGITAAACPAIASTSGPITSATATISPASLTSATLTRPSTQTVKATFTGSAWCDLNASPSLCVNLRNGSCSAGTVVQGYHFETTDDNEAIEMVLLNGGRFEFTFNKCGTGYCIAHARNHNLYLSACSSAGPDTWVTISGPGYSNMFTPGGGAHMWASSVEGAQMGLSGATNAQTEWYQQP